MNDELSSSAKQHWEVRPPVKIVHSGDLVIPSSVVKILEEKGMSMLILIKNLGGYIVK